MRGPIAAQARTVHGDAAGIVLRRTVVRALRSIRLAPPSPAGPFVMICVDATLFGSPNEPLASLLYRYWFWGWLFVDVSHRDLFRRAEALRHNVAQRVHLPCYMRRWSLCTFMMLGLGFALERGIANPWSIASAYTAAVLALMVLIVTASGWLLLATCERRG